MINKFTFYLLLCLDQEEIVKLLLMHGANINAVNVDKRTPLHLAIQYGKTNLKWKRAIEDIGIRLFNKSSVNNEKKIANNKCVTAT